MPPTQWRLPSRSTLRIRRCGDRKGIPRRSRRRSYLSSSWLCGTAAWFVYLVRYSFPRVRGEKKRNRMMQRG
ncbi:hypothetical protein BDV33DRAFT_173364 [Aspergillus novoparasiticus]|uniref:Uncharacterized protein n=1 Tax=Aspergillus novoparasiticus TaxID=986946 RepID=A0A5N6ESF7_9EURO|nr:hypothetical protein BDV33DRAFT_173364 [Aspergillus novoparasiticus]